MSSLNEAYNKNINKTVEFKWSTLNLEFFLTGKIHKQEKL